MNEFANTCASAAFVAFVATGSTVTWLLDNDDDASCGVREPLSPVPPVLPASVELEVPVVDLD